MDEITRASNGTTHDYLVTLAATRPVINSTGLNTDADLAIAKRVFIITLASVGVIANLLVIIALFRVGKKFPSITATFLKNQSVADAMVCVCGIIVGTQGSEMFKSSSYIADVILCFMFNNQLMYWLFSFISCQSLVCLAAERYLAVCKPFTYMQVRNSKSKHAIIICCVYLYSIAILVPSHVRTTRYSDKGVCKIFFEYEFDNSFFVIFLVLSWPALYFWIPLITVCTLYTMVFIGLKRSSKLNNQSHNSTLARASAQITRTALIVTSLHISLVGYESTYFPLMYFGLVSYTKTAHFISNVLTIANSVANPFIYVLTMPIFKNSFKGLCCQSKHAVDNKKHTYSK